MSISSWLYLICESKFTEYMYVYVMYICTNVHEYKMYVCTNMHEYVMYVCTNVHDYVM